MPQQQRPRSVPADLWSRPDLRDACRALDVGAILRAYRRHTGLSQQRVGEIVDIPQSAVSEYENRVHRATTVAVIARVAAGLDIPSDLLPLVPPPSDGRHAPTAAWGPAHIVEELDRATRGDLMLGRRELVEGAAAAGGALVNPLRRWLTQGSTALPHGTSSGISPDELAHLAVTATAFRTWDVQYGGGLRRKAVIGQLNEVVDHLRDPHPAAAQAELYRITADLAETAGSVLWDIGQHQRAQTYYTLGVKAAAQAGDPALAAHILATMAVQCVELGHLRTGLDLVQMAQHTVRDVEMPRLDSMLATREGWICAQLGRIQDTHRAIGTAEDAFARTAPGDAPTWLGYFTAAELAGTTASDYRDLAVHDRGQLARSADRFERSLALRGTDSPRSTAFDLTELAKIRLRQGDVEQACTTGHAAVDAATGLHSFRVRQRLSELFDATTPYRHITPCADLRERVAPLARATI
ncbi:helix-turn-helix domain-containing protein [Embleya sp. AB8]|uniref:helix-turn-helix domain-containing protein n=1 Tax=Embleya sp. AB8 TaxID=3156304 RepID=UPI003C72FC67